MNENPVASSASIVPPVTESLSVEPSAQASETLTKRVIMLVLVVLFIGGSIVFVRSGNSPQPEEQQPPAAQVLPQATPSPAGVAAQPASTPKGKDFGL